MSGPAALPAGPLLAWYGDDFTGAAAVMELLVAAGLPAALFMRPPNAADLARFPGLKGIGVAGTARSRSPTWMESELPSVFEALVETRAQLLHYKTCSTMDSSATTGSIGKAIEIGLRITSGWVPLVPAAPPLRRYQVFGTLFAAAGDGIHRLDRHPTMRSHPVTPMVEADVRRIVADQTDLEVGLIDYLELARDSGEEALVAAREAGASVIAVDVADDAAMRQAGELLWEQRGEVAFVVGSQGIEYALIEYLRSIGALAAAQPAPRAKPAARIAAVSGSCSPLTRQQIAWALDHGFKGIRLDPRTAVDESSWAAECARGVELACRALGEGWDPLLYTALGPDDPSVSGLSEAILISGSNPERVNARIGNGLGSVLQNIVERTDVRRLAVAGGDTSGFVSEALGVEALTLSCSISPAVALFDAHGEGGALGFELSFKGGQMGPPDLFGLVKEGGPRCEPKEKQTMTKIALLGAGGKMGVRLATNLRKSRFNVDHVEVSDAGRARLREELGVECVDQQSAIEGADVIVLAVPDRLIGQVATAIIDQVKPGAALIALDAAAPFTGQMPDRKDVTYFVTHPCHPPLFNDETDLDAKRDFFGGDKAKQAIVCALMQGPEEHYALCEEVARTIYSPVMRAHRCTLEQMAILEPALSETVGATLCQALKDATDEAARRGVPYEAAFDFMMGHLNIELAIIFGVGPGRFSDGAIQAINDAKPLVFRDGWLENVFSPEAVMASTLAIVQPASA